MRSVRIGNPDLRFAGEIVHEPLKLLGRQEPCLIGIMGLGKVTVFHAFGKVQEIVAFPYEPFNLVGAPAAEQEEGSGDKER